MKVCVILVVLQNRLHHIVDLIRERKIYKKKGKEKEK